MLSVPATLTHVFADILKNRRQPRLGIAMVASISETDFASNDFTAVGKKRI
jgi:hypothetical protein